MVKNNTIVSFILATNRPYELFAKKVVDSLYSQPTEGMEIVICGTDKIDDDRVVFIQDDVKINGPIATNIALGHASGDYLAILTDDHFPYLNWMDIPSLFDCDYFKDKKFHVATARSDGVCRTGDGIPSFLMCRFPVLSREALGNLGGVLFHPAFNLKSPHYPDCYLSYFLGVNNNECIELPLQLVSFQNDDPSFIDTDSYKEGCRQILLNLVENYVVGDPYV